MVSGFSAMTSSFLEYWLQMNSGSEIGHDSNMHQSSGKIKENKISDHNVQ